MKPIRHLDLFSGIGGFALAAKWVGGIETIGFCEIDEWARKVLNKNFPSIPIHHDVKTLDPKNHDSIELITAGYPCQPFSVAGKQKGKDDDRHLWPEVFRIIKGSRPRMVLCENVAGHVNMGLDDVLSDLESEGYSAQSIIIPACAVDAKHRRDRVWIMAYATIIDDGSCDQGENKRQISKFGKGGSAEDVADTDNERLSQLHNAAKSDDKGQLTRGFAEGWRETERWASESGLGRVAHGIPNRIHRLKGLGNAIVPQVAAEILRVMMTVNQQSK